VTNPLPVLALVCLPHPVSFVVILGALGRILNGATIFAIPNGVGISIGCPQANSLNE